MVVSVTGTSQLSVSQVFNSVLHTDHMILLMIIDFAYLVHLLGHYVDDGVDDDTGELNDVGDDVDCGVFVAFIKLAIIRG